MPFKSKAQRRKLYATDPELARRFEAETPKGKALPERVKPRGPSKRSRTSASATARSGSPASKRPAGSSGSKTKPSKPSGSSATKKRKRSA